MSALMMLPALIAGGLYLTRSPASATSAQAAGVVTAGQAAGACGSAAGAPCAGSPAYISTAYPAYVGAATVPPDQDLGPGRRDDDPPVRADHVDLAHDGDKRSVPDSVHCGDGSGATHRLTGEHQVLEAKVQAAEHHLRTQPVLQLLGQQCAEDLSVHDGCG